MAVESDEDRLAFFDPEAFGLAATITLNDSTVLTVTGIFDDPNVTKGLRQNNQFTYAQGQDVSSAKPEFYVRTMDIPGVRNGRATIDIAGVVYTVFNVEHDGTGISCLRLMRA